MEQAATIAITDYEKFIFDLKEFTVIPEVLDIE